MATEFKVECANCEKPMFFLEQEDLVELEDGQKGNWLFYLCRKCKAHICIFKELKSGD